MLDCVRKSILLLEPCPLGPNRRPRAPHCIAGYGRTHCGFKTFSQGSTPNPSPFTFAAYGLTSLTCPDPCAPKHPAPAVRAISAVANLTTARPARHSAARALRCRGSAAFWRLGEIIRRRPLGLRGITSAIAAIRPPLCAYPPRCRCVHCAPSILWSVVCRLVVFVSWSFQRAA